jgi:energy-coupling factor transporter ATP-binding protein EcfA2
MTDPRLETLRDTVAEPGTSYDPIKIDHIKLSDYKFFHGDFELAFNGKNVLIYGENGSGKSSIYKALGFLAKQNFGSIANEKNIFAENSEPSIAIGFSNGKEIIIDSDLTEIPLAFQFLKSLSIFKPMLDYKQLLPVHYLPGGNGGKVNVYELLREMFKNYPVTEGSVLSGIIEPRVYFESLKGILNEVLLNAANTNLAYFESDLRISLFAFKEEFAPDGSLKPVINIEIDFKEFSLDTYHTFLNEARLTALALSLYFAAIRKLHSTVESECLKILVLDDLLISLDMSNRLKLLEILKAEFADFQIFFFTHDKELFELYKNKMVWEVYELYLDDSESIPKPIVKKGSTPIEKAKVFFAKKEYDACALMLRKDFEKTLKLFLPPRDQRDKNCNELDLSHLVGKSIAATTGEARQILEKLDSDRKHILNPLSHVDDRAIFSQELKTAMQDLEKLKKMLR